MPAKIISTVLLLLVALNVNAQSDPQILAMGRDAWISKVRSEQGIDDGTLTGAEKRFSMALAIEKEKLISQSPDRLRLDSVDILLSNITKCACRVGDYSHVGSGHELWVNAKAATAMVIAMHNIVKLSPSPVTFKQRDVWQRFKTARTFHEQSRERIEKFSQEKSGYTFKQTMLEFDAIGTLMTKTLKLMSVGTVDQKKHLFDLFIRMIDVTTGSDPLPTP